METPILTVAIPMYRASRIGWLSLESFARQQSPPVPWELIVLEDEEDDDRLGETGLAPYREALAQAGCVRVVYEIMPGQPALSLKWRHAAQLASPSSEVFLLQGCDDYCDAQRLVRTHRLFSGSTIDWSTTRFGLFYDIGTGVTAWYDNATKPAYSAPVNGRARHSTGLDMATRTAYARQLPAEEVRRGVDHWFCCSVSDHLGRELEIFWDESEPDWGASLYTNGLNTISQLRWKQTFLPVIPFLPTEMGAEDVLPAAVLQRLKLLADCAARRIVEQLLELATEQEAKLQAVNEKVAVLRNSIQSRDAKIAKRDQQIATFKERLAKQRAKTTGTDKVKPKRRWLDWLPS
jgi:hypothetical protein